MIVALPGLFSYILRRHVSVMIRAYADSKCQDQTAHKDLHYLVTESFDTKECMNGVQRPK